MWHGRMWWPVKLGWVCETCGWTHGMTWGLIHGECRCDRCHTHYYMGTLVEMREVPLCILKPDYIEPAKKGWKHFQTPISEWDDATWDQAFTLAKQEEK